MHSSFNFKYNKTIFYKYRDCDLNSLKGLIIQNLESLEILRIDIKLIKFQLILKIHLINSKNT